MPGRSPCLLPQPQATGQVQSHHLVPYCFLPLNALLFLCLANFYSFIKGLLKEPLLQAALPVSPRGPIGPASPLPGSPPCVTPRSLGPASPPPGSPPRAPRQLTPPCSQHLMAASPDMFHVEWQLLLHESLAQAWLRGLKGPVPWARHCPGHCGRGQGSLPVPPARGTRFWSGCSRGMGPRTGPRRGCTEPARTSVRPAAAAPAHLRGEMSDV